jgi:hypothetical protein
MSTPSNWLPLDSIFSSLDSFPPCEHATERVDHPWRFHLQVFISPYPRDVTTWSMNLRFLTAESGDDRLQVNDMSWTRMWPKWERNETSTCSYINEFNMCLSGLSSLQFQILICASLCQVLAHAISAPELSAVLQKRTWGRSFKFVINALYSNGWCTCFFRLPRTTATIGYARLRTLKTTLFCFSSKPRFPGQIKLSNPPS